MHNTRNLTATSEQDAVWLTAGATGTHPTEKTQRALNVAPSATQGRSQPHQCELQLAAPPAVLSVVVGDARFLGVIAKNQSDSADPKRGSTRVEDHVMSRSGGSPVVMQSCVT